MHNKILKEQSLEDLVTSVRKSSPVYKDKTTISNTNSPEGSSTVTKADKSQEKPQASTTKKGEDRKSGVTGGESSSLAVKRKVSPSESRITHASMMSFANGIENANLEDVEDLVLLMQQANFSKSCIDYVKDNLGLLITAALSATAGSYLIKAKFLTTLDLYNTATIGLIPKAAGAAASKIASGARSLKQFSRTKTGIFALALGSLGLGIAGNQTWNKIRDKDQKSIIDAAGEAADVLGTGLIMYPGNIYDKAGPVLSGEESDCAPIVFMMIAAASLACAYLIKTPRPIKEAKTLIFSQLKKLIKKYGNDSNKKTTEAIKKVLERAESLGPKISVKLSEVIKGSREIPREEAKKLLRSKFEDVEKLNLKEAEDILDTVYDEIDGVFKTLDDFAAARAKKLSRGADREILKSEIEIKQMGFDFGEVDQGPRLTAVYRVLDDGFDSGDMRSASNSLQELYQFYLEKGLLKEKDFQKQMATMVKGIKSENPNLSESELFLKFVRQMNEKLPAPGNFQLDDTLSAGSVSNVADNEVVGQIENQVEDIVRHNTQNLPDLSETEFKAIRGSVLDSTKDLYKKLASKHPKKAAAVLALSIVGAGLGAVWVNQEDYRPTGSPWKFPVSFLNSLNGRSGYEILKNKVLNDSTAQNQFLDLVFDKNNKIRNQFIEDLAKEGVPDNPDEYADEVLKAFAGEQKVEILKLLEKVTGAAAKPETLYGTADAAAVERKKEVIFTIISELFFYNNTLRKKLSNYFKQTVPTGAGSEKRKRELEMIFSKNKSMINSFVRDKKQVNNFFKNDYRKKTSVGSGLSLVSNDNKQANKEKVSPQAAAAEINEFFNKSMKEMIKIPLADRKDAVRKYLQASGASQKAGLPVEVFVALIGKESGFINKDQRGDTDLESGDGPSYGLGQILRITAEEITKKTDKELEDYLDIASNNLDTAAEALARITRYLRGLKVWKKANVDEKLQLKLYAYNMGSGNVRKRAKTARGKPQDTLDLLQRVYKPKKPYALDILERARYSSDVTVNPKESIVYNLDNLKGLVSEVITEQQESELPSLQDKLAANLEPRIATADPGMGEYYNKVLKFAQTKLPFGDNVYRVEYGAIQNTTENAPALLDEETADSFYNLLLDWLNTGLKPLKLHGKTPSYDSVLDASDRNETSQHKHGMALDINIPFGSNDPMHLKYKQKLLELALNNGFRGFGFGPTVMHIDTRQEYGWWIYGGEKWDFAGAIGRVVPLRSDAFRELGLAAGGWPTSKVKQTFLAMTDVRNKKGVREMSKKDIRQLVAEVLNESYSKYDYNSNEYTEDEPNEDYQVEWSAMVDEVCDARRKNIDGDPRTFEDTAIEVAKILVKDSDLFRDVLEMAGSNKSIGVEIMQQLKAAKEKKTLDKKENV